MRARWVHIGLAVAHVGVLFVVRFVVRSVACSVTCSVAHVEVRFAARSAVGVVDIDMGAAGILVVACFVEASLDTHPSAAKLGA